MKNSFRQPLAVLGLSLAVSLAVTTVYAQQETTPAAVASSEGSSYLERVDSFTRSFSMQIHEIFIPQALEHAGLAHSEKQKITAMAETLSEAIAKKIVQFKIDYRSQFMDLTKDEAAKVRLLDAESDIKWAAERSLGLLIGILDKLDKEPKIQGIEKEMTALNEISNLLNTDKRMTKTVMDLIRNMFPMRKSIAKTVCSIISRVCVNQDISKIYEKMSTKSFTKSSIEDLEVRVLETDGKVSQSTLDLPKNAAVVFAMSHDNVILDIKSMMILADKMGVDRNMILTTQDSWPQTKIWANKDPSILFIQEKGLSGKIIQNMKEQPDQRVGFTIYPEGNVPFWGIQFPLTAKFGAFVIARKAAVALKDQRPLYYIEVQSNFLENATASKDVGLRLDVIKPQLVPTTPVEERDVWVENARRDFEVRANHESRRGKQYDLIHRQKNAGTMLNTVNDVRPYEAFMRCEKMF
jgi:hypothetical protein